MSGKNAEVIDHCCCLQSALLHRRDFSHHHHEEFLRLFGIEEQPGPREKLGQKWVKFSPVSWSGFSTVVCVAKFPHQHKRGGIE